MRRENVGSLAISTVLLLTSCPPNHLNGSIWSINPSYSSTSRCPCPLTVSNHSRIPFGGWSGWYLLSYSFLNPSQVLLCLATFAFQLAVARLILAAMGWPFASFSLVVSFRTVFLDDEVKVVEMMEWVKRINERMMRTRLTVLLVLLVTVDLMA